MEKKLFAFKLADKRAEATTGKKWKAREGVSVASCTLVDPVNYEYRSWKSGDVMVGRDEGDYC